MSRRDQDFYDGWALWQEPRPQTAEDWVEVPEEWDEWLTLYASRNDLAETYAALLRLEDSAWPGWAELNAAILRRWSPAALRYIKERAWKIANQDL